MPNLKNTSKKIKKSYLQVIGVVLLIALAALLLIFNNQSSNQSSGTSPALIYFDGEYRIEGGDWQPIEVGEHIPATKGDVTLRIHFRMMDPDGNPMDDKERSVPVALYLDHIGLSFYVDGVKVRVTDNENPQIGESACGESWTMHTVKTDSPTPTEIVVHNPHGFGNETAIDELLANVAVWGNMDFEKEILNRGEPQRNVGMLLMLVSIVFLGIALFSSLIHIKNSRAIWIIGLVVLFAGLYIVYSAVGVSFWSESVTSNTTILCFSMMFYMLFVSMTIACILRRTKRVGNVTLIVLSLANAVFFVLPLITEEFFYDLLAWWALVQTAACISLVVCLSLEFAGARKRETIGYVGAFLPLVAFIVDVLGTWLGTWKGGVASLYVFVLLFILAMIMVLRFIPQSINAATKARELELEKTTLNAQLAESRISTMMSQIRPHFIYNTLGSIEQLCKLDPTKAGDLVHNFAKYLRGNFGELDNPKPILMSQEMEHVHHYISIENVRFPDMTFAFEMRSEDFHIPALTVQPIVENAIKHGLMRLPRGGRIDVVSYETDSEYCVSVIDDGVGFDTGALLDDRKHVGLRNIRERLKVMVNGTLEIESTVGVGTKVLIKIPKEAKK